MFKGGTSLSQLYNLIDRSSEDAAFPDHYLRKGGKVTKSCIAVIYLPTPTWPGISIHSHVNVLSY